jgi:hypothetical protein
MRNNPILDGSNAFISVANLQATTQPTADVPWVPLGTVGATTTGEVGAKVVVIGGASAGGVTTSPYQYSSTSAFAAPTGATTAQTLFTVAAGQAFFVQNQAAAALYVKFGTGASASSYSICLKAAGTADDGTGGFLYRNDRLGPVSVFPASGTSRYVAWTE